MPPCLCKLGAVGTPHPAAYWAQRAAPKRRAARSLTPVTTLAPTAPIIAGFTLDSRIGEFVLSHDDIKIPDPGQRIYSGPHSSVSPRRIRSRRNQNA